MKKQRPRQGAEDVAGGNGVTPNPIPATAPDPVPKATYRIADWVKTLGVSRRLVESYRSSGRLPKPDLFMGCIPLWRIETVRGFLEWGGRP
jgi:hypothetical protein